MMKAEQSAQERIEAMLASGQIDEEECEQLRAAMEGEAPSSTHPRESALWPRDLERAWLSGVCAGLARGMGVPVPIVRLVTAFATAFLAALAWYWPPLWVVSPALLYVALDLIMPPDLPPRRREYPLGLRVGLLLLGSGIIFKIALSWMAYVIDFAEAQGSALPSFTILAIHAIVPHTGWVSLAAAVVISLFPLVFTALSRTQRITLTLIIALLFVVSLLLSDVPQYQGLFLAPLLLATPFTNPLMLAVLAGSFVVCLIDRPEARRRLFWLLFAGVVLAFALVFAALGFGFPLR